MTIGGVPGSVKTDADGRFTFAPSPAPPFQVIVVLASGQVARPVLITAVDCRGDDQGQRARGRIGDRRRRGAEHRRLARLGDNAPVQPATRAAVAREPDAGARDRAGHQPGVRRSRVGAGDPGDGTRSRAAPHRRRSRHIRAPGRSERDVPRPRGPRRHRRRARTRVGRVWVRRAWRRHFHADEECRGRQPAEGPRQRDVRSRHAGSTRRGRGLQGLCQGRHPRPGSRAWRGRLEQSRGRHRHLQFGMEGRRVRRFAAITRSGRAC